MIFKFKPNHNTRGFTLLETIVVVFVIGLMVAVVVPIFFKQNKALELKKDIAELVSSTKIKSMGIDRVNIYKPIDKYHLYKGIALHKNELKAVEWDSQEKQWQKIVNIAPVDISELNLSIILQGRKIPKIQTRLKPFMIFKNDNTASVILYNNGQPYLKINSMGDVSYEE